MMSVVKSCKLAPESCWKVAGLAALIAYLAVHPPFLDWAGIVAYLAVTLGTGVVAEVAINPIFRIGRVPGKCGSRLDGSLPPDSGHRMWRQASGALGGDGLCFVPLLLVGPNPITAEVAAVAFAALHFPRHSLQQCAWKALHVFSVVVVVMPYGLASVAIGHLIALAIAHRFGELKLLRPILETTDGPAAGRHGAPPEIRQQ